MSDSENRPSTTTRFKRTRMEYKGIQEGLETGRVEKRGLSTVLATLPLVENAYRKVERANEAVLDSLAVAEMTSITEEETRKMELNSSVSFDVHEYVKSLATFLGPPTRADDSSSLARLGVLGLGSSLRPATTDFMVGPLSTERKLKAVGTRTRRDIDENARERPKQLQYEDVKQGQKMTAIIQDIYKTLQTYNATPDSPVSLFEFVLNPKSFSQSVENLFYLSFLVHDGKVTLNVDEDNIPVIGVQYPLPTDPVERRKEEKQREQVPPQQMIFDLDPGAWQALVESFEITEPAIVHREPDASRDIDPENPTWYS